MIDHLLDKHGRESGRVDLTLSEDARAALNAHDWPGNVRELSNAIERAVVLSRDDAIDVDDLPTDIQQDLRRRGSVRLQAKVDSREDGAVVRVRTLGRVERAGEEILIRRRVVAQVDCRSAHHVV